MLSLSYLKFDFHSDLLFSVIRERSMGRDQVIKEDFLPEMSEGGINARVAAIYMDESFLPEMALRRALDFVHVFDKEIDETDELVKAEKADDIRDAWDSGKYALMLGMEGAEPIKNDLRLLNIFHKLGLRVLTLTHSRRNKVGDGSFFFPKETGKPGGLSEFGVKVIKKMNELGIVVDVSHINDPGFWDVIEYTEDPVVASHSNCRELKDHPRNLNDEQIKALAENGGVMGMNTAGIFVEDDPDIDDYLNHLNHVVDVAGAEHVGLGFDFCDYLIKYLSEEEKERLPDVSPVSGLECDEDVQRLPRELSERGYTDEEIRLFMGENFLRVLEEVID